MASWRSLHHHSQLLYNHTTHESRDKCEQLLQLEAPAATPYVQELGLPRGLRVTLPRGDRCAWALDVANGSATRTTLTFLRAAAPLGEASPSAAAAVQALLCGGSEATTYMDRWARLSPLYTTPTPKSSTQE